MFEKIQRVRHRHKMSPSLHLGASQLALLSLTLLLAIPRTVTSYPHSLPAPLPREDGPDLESTLLQLQAALDDPGAAWLIPLNEPLLGLLEPRKEEELLLRTQRGDLKAQLLSPFPGGQPLESMSYPDGGEDGGKRNNALTFIAGGLQAVSREKGGIGFRFGRK